jgi:peptidoglycan/xylan/chitin deacetylase (PgdA/CDA1 family)
MRIALTIDIEHPDRPCDPENADIMVEILKDEGVKATFFVQGAWALAHPGLLRRIRDDGHLIGSHGHWHAPLPYLTTEGIRQTLLKAESALDSVAGVDPRPWFRFPYGESDKFTRSIIKAMGYGSVRWDIDPKDWQPEATVASICESAEWSGEVTADPVKFILHSWPDATRAALRPLIGRLRPLGSFVRLDET